MVLRINPTKKRSTNPIIRFCIRPTADFCASVLPALVAYCNPENTTINTHTNAVIKVAYLMSPPSIFCTVANPPSTVHLNLRFVTPDPLPSGTHLAHGIFSVTVTVTSAAATVLENNPPAIIRLLVEIKTPITMRENIYLRRAKSGILIQK